jgi:hypothetical protein
MPVFALAQNQRFHGTILNDQTRLPVANVNMKIRNSTNGTATNSSGKFELLLGKLPVVIDITCIGYESLTVEIGEVKAKPVGIRIKPLIRQLEGVTISDLKATAVYRDPDYSVLDYELMGDNLRILIFKYQLKRSILLCMSRDGDTLAQSSLPELPPLKLFRDVLGNVHYFSKKGNAFQCHYDAAMNHLGFPYHTTVDSLLRAVGNFTFLMKNRLYFEEVNASGFKAKIGYYDKERGKIYLQNIQDGKAISNYYRDRFFFIAPSRPGDTVFRDNDARAYDFFTRKKCLAGMVKIGEDRMAVFNLMNDVIEIRDEEGRIVEKVPISFHKDPEYAFIASFARSFFPGETWKWSGKILKDEANENVYTTYRKNGWVRISKIDIMTGSLNAEYVIPVAFPEKIRIHHGEAYYLYKGVGLEEKWKLYKMKL